MLTYRFAGKNDVDLFFEWANDEVSRSNSYHSGTISYEEHVKWFQKRVNAENYSFYIFQDREEKAIGQVRIEKDPVKQEALISISVDKEHRGKGYSAEMLRQASEDFLSRNSGFTIVAFIFKTNEASYRSFVKAGYLPLKESVIRMIPSYILTYTK